MIASLNSSVFVTLPSTITPVSLGTGSAVAIGSLISRVTLPLSTPSIQALTNCDVCRNGQLSRVKVVLSPSVRRFSARLTLKRPSDVVVDKRDEQHARVWLSIHFSGESRVDQLTVVHGPGQIDIDEDGKPYYQADAASPAHFCVVGAVWRLSPDSPITLEGFIVLPLPLGQHSQAYQALEQAAQRATRR